MQRAPENEQRSFEEHSDKTAQRSERIGAKSGDFIPFGALAATRVAINVISQRNVDSAIVIMPSAYMCIQTRLDPTWNGQRPPASNPSSRYPVVACPAKVVIEPSTRQKDLRTTRPRGQLQLP